MDRAPQLQVIEGALAGRSYEVTEEGLVIGRSDDCEIQLPDPGVSRQHARVFMHNAGVWVQDMGSRNGAYVKGKRIVRPKQLSPGAPLKVGDHTFSLTVPPADSAEPVATIPPEPLPTVEPSLVNANEPTAVVKPGQSGSSSSRTLIIVGVVAVLAAIIAAVAAGVSGG